MIAYQSLDMLQQQLSDITKQITCDLIKSICGNEFNKSTFKCSLMSNWYNWAFLVPGLQKL